MKKKGYFMTFYSDIALLHSVQNKQSLFLAGMISRMNGDNIVQMSRYTKKEILREIGSKSSNDLNLARQYISILTAAGIIKALGDDAYMIIPKLFGFSNVAGSINEKQDKFIKIKYKNNNRTIEVGLLHEKDES